jgi:hypothetical protein
MIRALALALGLSLAACRDERTAAGTGLYVEVRFTGVSTPLTQLRFTVKTAAGDHVLGPVTRPDPAGGPLGSPQTARVRLPDSQAGVEMVVAVEGLAGGAVAATGEGRAIVALGSEQDVVVTLEPVAASPRLAFSSAAQSVVAGTCSAPVTLAVLDAQSQPLPLGEAVQVNLTSSAPSTTFYSDAACAQAVTSLTIAQGASAATFRFKDTAAGTLALTASPVSSTLAAVTQQQTVTPAGAAAVAFTLQPGNAVAGQFISPAPVVAVQDAFGNVISGWSEPVTVSIGANPGAGMLAGQTSLPAPGGSAVFSGLSINRSGNGYRLMASSGSLATALSDPFDVAAGAAVTLTFATPPSNALVNRAITPPVRVAVVDALGNTVTGPAVDITVSLQANPGGGTLGGTLTASTVEGIATFSNLSVSTAGTGYTLRAAAPGGLSVVSGGFDVAPSGTNVLVFLQQPAGAQAGAAITPPIQVAVQDGSGVTQNVAVDITLSISTNPGGGTLSGTTTVTSSGGIASFTGLSIDRAAAGYVLTASAPALLSAVSDAFTISPAAPAALAFSAQPTTAVAGAAISPPVQVQVRDAYGNLVTSSSASISLALETNPGGGTLGGTTTVTAINGVSTFSNLAINRAGVGYSLRATSSGLSPAVSGAFDITVGPAARLSFTSQPSNTPVDSIISPPVQVTIQDSQGNRVSSSAPVTVSLAANPGGATLGGTTTVNASAGVATFSNLSLNRPGTGYTMGAASTGLAGATSASFNITPPAPATLVLSPPSHDYGTVATGGTRSQTFTLTNTGSTTATQLMPQPLFYPFQQTSGDCTDKLEPQQSCMFVVEYTPSFPSTLDSATLQFDYHDGTVSRAVSGQLSGRAVPPASLQISESPAYDYGQVVTGTPATHAFTVTNSGGMAASSMSGGPLLLPFRYAGGSYPGAGGDCGSTLAINASCTVVVEFLPAARGSFQDTLQVQYDSGAFPTSVSTSLSGQGASAAQLVISDGPGPFGFGTWGVGRPVDHAFVVENIGDLPATSIAGGALAAPFSYKGGGGYPGVGGTCGTTLPARGRCWVVVTFAPASPVSSSETLTLSYLDGRGMGSSYQAMTGSGTTAARLVLTDFPLPYYSVYGVPSDGPLHQFGAQGLDIPAVRPFYLTNTGVLTATGIAGSGLTTPFSFHGGAFPGQGGTCTGSLGPGEQCVVMLEFTPKTGGPHTSTAQVSYVDGASSTLTATRVLEGSGTTYAALRIEDFDGIRLGTAWEFGERGVGVSSDWTFWVRNTGAQAASGMSGSFLGTAFNYRGGAFPGAGGTCGSDLEPGGICLITVSFTPASVGEHTDSVDVQYQDGSGVFAAAHRAVRGTGATGPVLIFDNRNGGGGGLFFDFGPRAINSTTPAPFTLLNVGTDPTSGTLSGPGLPAPFSFNGGTFPGAGGNCGPALAVGQSCQIAVSYSPAAVGGSAANVRVNYPVASGTRSVERGLIGRGVTGAVLAIHDYSQGGGDQSDPFSFGTAGVVTDHTFHVRNIGDVAAAGVTVGALTGRFAVTGHTCPSDLGAGAACTVTVRFTPVAAEQRHGATLQVTYLAGTSTTRATRDLFATSTQYALILSADFQDATEFRPTPLDFGTSGQPVDRVLYLINRGGADATGLQDQPGLGGSFEYKGGSYPGLGGSCGSVLRAGDRCSVMLTFTPLLGDGIRSGMVHLDYGGGASPVSKVRHALVGVATSGPYLVIRDYPTGGNPSGPYNYGTAGVAVDHTFTVDNVGGGGAFTLGGGMMGNGFGFKGGSFPGAGGTCQTMGLGPGQQCTVVVTFTPSGDGPRSSAVVVSYQGSGGPAQASRPVVGTATSRALLRIVDESWQTQEQFNPYDFGVTGMPVDHVFHVQSVGALAATALGSTGPIGMDFAFKGGTYPGSGGTCGNLLPSGSTCAVVVTFSPTGNGLRTGRISIGYQDSGGSRPPALRDVSGTATQAANLVIEDFDGGGGCTVNCGPYNFGLWGVPVDHTFTVRNTGAQAASSLGSGAPMGNGFAFRGGSGAFPGTGGTCSAATPLAAGATCTVVVTFTPSGDGPRSSRLELAYNDGATGRTVGRAISGTATTDPYLLITDFSGASGCPGGACSPFDYGTWGIPADHTFHVRNNGGSAARSMSGSLSGLEFNFKDGSYPGTGGTCGGDLDPATTCTLVVTFTAPPPPGLKSGTLTLYYSNSSFGSFSTSRSLVGTSTSRAFLTVYDMGTSGCSDSSCGPYDYGSTTGTRSHTFTVFNSGAQRATGLGSGGFSGPFNWGGGLNLYPGGGTCPTIVRDLDAGSSCTIVVDFTPPASGSFSGRVNLQYSDSFGGTLTTGRNLRGSRP